MRPAAGRSSLAISTVDALRLVTPDVELRHAVLVDRGAAADQIDWRHAPAGLIRSAWLTFLSDRLSN
jgi:hypothetical protein